MLEVVLQAQGPQLKLEQPVVVVLVLLLPLPLV